MVSPDGSTCITRVNHPAYGSAPSANALWDALQIVLSGIAARMVVHGKLQARECDHDLSLARNLAEKLAAQSPFAHQPRYDMTPIGKFRVSSTYTSKPQML